jgi:hypothetical protein
MARRKHTPERIIGKLWEADRLLAERADVAAAASGNLRADRSPVAEPVRRDEG